MKSTITFQNVLKYNLLVCTPGGFWVWMHTQTGALIWVVGRTDLVGTETVVEFSFDRKTCSGFVAAMQPEQCCKDAGE